MLLHNFLVEQATVDDYWEHHDLNRVIRQSEERSTGWLRDYALHRETTTSEGGNTKRKYVHSRAAAVAYGPDPYDQ